MQDPKQVADRRGWRCGQMPVTLLLAGSDHLHREPHETWAPAAVLPPDCRQKATNMAAGTDPFHRLVQGVCGQHRHDEQFLALLALLFSPSLVEGPHATQAVLSAAAGRTHPSGTSMSVVAVSQAYAWATHAVYDLLKGQLVGDAPNNRRRSQSASGFASKATKRSSPSVERSCRRVKQQRLAAEA